MPSSNEPSITSGEPAARKRHRLRQFSARLGLEGKILTAMMMLLTVSLGATSWVWATQSNDLTADLLGEQARQIAQTLSLASKPALTSRNTKALQFISRDLLKTRDVLFVIFYDAGGSRLAIAQRDSVLQSSAGFALHPDVRMLMRVQAGTSPMMGNFLQVSAPVVASPAQDGEPSAGSHLLGYVTVGVSVSQKQGLIYYTNFMAVGIGCIVVLLSLPLAYLMVHRIFWPIRQLVAATDRIAAGELDVQVAIDRPDAIGDLRAFNEMVITVKRQKDDLQEANGRLELANDDLEEKVTQRTSQLETANMRLSREIAEKEDFLRAVSHDLNAPLRNISGMAAMLLMKHRQSFDEDIVHRLERIQKNVEVETDLISELLELSRIKTRRQKMEMVEVVSLVRELEGMFENDLTKGSISFVIDTDLPVLNAERARLRQVFQNLIDNAVKYMGDGPTREIHIGCEIHGTEAEFYVRDTGLGIEAEELQKVFGVFRRGKNTSARNVPGKGVGLASVKSIIETYSGTIWVESTVGAGSTFRFTINGQYVATTGLRPAQRKVNA